MTLKATKEGDKNHMRILSVRLKITINLPKLKFYTQENGKKPNLARFYCYKKIPRPKTNAFKHF